MAYSKTAIVCTERASTGLDHDRYPIIQKKNNCYSNKRVEPEAEMVGGVRVVVLFVVGAFTLSAGAWDHMESSADSLAPPIAFYPYQQGWLGADSAYSIPLSPERSVWLFGDTFVGAPNAIDRTSVYGMPRNSVGISNCAEGVQCSLKYYWSSMGTTHPRSYFDSGPGEWLWPLDGFLWHGTLYIFLQGMHAKGSGAFGFDYSGVKLATISNPMDSPDRWHVQYQTILGGNTVIPGVATVVAQGLGGNPFPGDLHGVDFVYAFTWTKANNGVRSLALTRIALFDLKHASLAAGHWQCLTSDGKWVSWNDPSALPHDAVHMLDGNYTGITVKFHSDAGRWLMVMPSSTFMDPHASYSTAESLAGPWSPAGELYSYPEMKPTHSSYSPSVFCYAPREHPELEHAHEIVLTYICKSTKDKAVMAEPKSYHPIPVSLKAPF
jgi:hypothetical protein